MRWPGLPTLETIERRGGAWCSIASGVALALAFFGVPSLLVGSVREAFYAGSLVLACFAIAGLCLSTRLRMYRKSRYADTLERVRNAVQVLMSRMGDDSLTGEAYHTALQSAVGMLTGAFTAFTGTHCRCCIKVVRLTGDCPSPTLYGPQIANINLAAVSLCRDGGVCERDAHPIGGNTDFNQLWQDKARKWFFGNNLPQMASKGRYNNSSTSWQDFYKASIVWPIRRVFADGSKDADLIGFLCVDSKSIGVFSEEFDYPVGAIVADSLYPFLKQLEQTQASDQPESREGPETSEPAQRPRRKGVPK